jgi:DNA-directed RNA polymerase specialized sigma24 family protein
VSVSSKQSLDADLIARAGLTDRQRECLELHLQGGSYRFIGDALGIDFSTVHGHVQRALRRMEKVMR